MLLVDTNVLVDVVEDDPDWADWSISQLWALSQVHALTINPIVYAELSVTFSTLEALDQTVSDLGLELVELPRPALFLAGKAFLKISPNIAAAAGRSPTSWPTSSSAPMPPSRAARC